MSKKVLKGLAPAGYFRIEENYEKKLLLYVPLKNDQYISCNSFFILCFLLERNPFCYNFVIYNIRLNKAGIYAVEIHLIGG